MSTVNKVILVGNLGADPEPKKVPSGTSVVNLRVATTQRWTDKNGQKQEATEWHRVVVWGKQAEVVGEYLTKGRQVYIEGRIQSREWQDQHCQKRRSFEIVAQNVTMLGASAATGTPPPEVEGAPAVTAPEPLEPVTVSPDGD